jgi:hypothetical protein
VFDTAVQGETSLVACYVVQRTDKKIAEVVEGCQGEDLAVHDDESLS